MQPTNVCSYEVKQVLLLMFSKRMRVLLPQIFWTGISLAVYSGLLVPMLISQMGSDMEGAGENEKFKRALICMVAFGVGEMVGA